MQKYPMKTYPVTIPYVRTYTNEHMICTNINVIEYSPGRARDGETYETQV